MPLNNQPRQQNVEVVKIEYTYSVSTASSAEHP